MLCTLRIKFKNQKDDLKELKKKTSRAYGKLDLKRRKYGILLLIDAELIEKKQKTAYSCIN